MHWMDPAAATGGRPHHTRRIRPPSWSDSHGHHPPLPITDLQLKDVDTGNIEHQIGSGAPARDRATHRVSTVAPSEVSCLVATDPEGPGAIPLKQADSAPAIIQAQIRRPLCC